MARPSTRKTRRFRWAAILAAMAVGVVAAIAGGAFGAELVTAELTGTTNDVTVTQGTSAGFTISVSATGAISSSITSANAATATVDTSYSISSAGALSSSTPSSSMKFYSSGTGCNIGGNCDVTWDGATTPYSVPATVSAASTTPTGTYTVTLSSSAGTTDETNPSVSGGKLGDATATTITVHVVAPVVTNVAPTVKTAAADATGSEGDTLQTSGAFQDADNDSLSISANAGSAGTLVDNGDGTWSWSLATTDQTSGSVTVTASDGHGHTVSDSFDYSAANVAPTATFNPPTSVNEGSSISLSLTSPSDPSSADTTAGFTYAFDCGDGSGYGSFSSTSTASCSTTDNGSRTVKGKIKDKDGGVSEYTANVTINNVAPTATFNAPTSVNEGSSISLSLTSPSDPSSADTTAGFTYAFDCGDGSGYGSFSLTSTASCSTTDNGSRTVKGKIKDKDGGVSEYTANVTINNVAPTVGTLTLGGATGTACTTGNNVTLDFGFSDPGVNDNPWVVDINWGDGSTHTTYNASSQGTQPQQSHSYGPGSFTISVSVTDRDGDAGSSSTTSNAVSHLYAMSGILAPFNSDGTSVWKYGSTIPVKVQITDCNGQPVSGLAPKVGTSLVSSTDPSLAIDETVSTSAADTTGVMRYDSTAGQYIYNFGSKNLSDPSATYYMTVKGTDSGGTIVTSPPMVQQKFGLKSK